MADQPKKPAGGRPTKAGIAAACAAALVICSPLVAMFEGKRNVTYLDIAKVPTKRRARRLNRAPDHHRH